MFFFSVQLLIQKLRNVTCAEFSSYIRLCLCFIALWMRNYVSTANSRRPQNKIGRHIWPYCTFIAASLQDGAAFLRRHVCNECSRRYRKKQQQQKNRRKHAHWRIRLCARWRNDAAVAFLSRAPRSYMFTISFIAEVWSSFLDALWGRRIQGLGDVNVSRAIVFAQKYTHVASNKHKTGNNNNKKHSLNKTVYYSLIFN